MDGVNKDNTQSGLGIGTACPSAAPLERELQWLQTPKREQECGCIQTLCWDDQVGGGERRHGRTREVCGRHLFRRFKNRTLCSGVTTFFTTTRGYLFKARSSSSTGFWARRVKEVFDVSELLNTSNMNPHAVHVT